MKSCMLDPMSFSFFVSKWSQENSASIDIWLRKYVDFPRKKSRSGEFKLSSIWSSCRLTLGTNQVSFGTQILSRNIFHGENILESPDHHSMGNFDREYEHWQKLIAETKGHVLTHWDSISTSIFNNKSIIILHVIFYTPEKLCKRSLIGITRPFLGYQLLHGVYFPLHFWSFV